MPTTPSCTAFQGVHRFATGTPLEVALAIRAATPGAPILIFDDATGKALDFDTRGTTEDIAHRLTPQTASEPSPESAPRGRGRPKLGVVAREVTLLPRHWDWLANQPGGASVALRKLVEQARRATGDSDRLRNAQTAAYNFISAIAGNFPGFEEATRALFAHDRRRFGDLVASWPADIRDHAIHLAFADLSPGMDL